MASRYARWRSFSFVAEVVSACIGVLWSKVWLLPTVFLFRQAATASAVQWPHLAKGLHGELDEFKVLNCGVPPRRQGNVGHCGDEPVTLRAVPDEIGQYSRLVHLYGGAESQ